MKPAAEIRDPIHGYIYLSQAEKDVLDTPTFQRLRRIRQLAGAHLTYPGAQHSRFEHSVGTMHLAGLAGRVLEEKGYLSDEDITKLRLGALLHDVGHGPFSHLIEEVMTEKRGTTHEDVTQRVIRETEVGKAISEHGMSPEELSTFAIGRSQRAPQFLNGVLAGGLSVDIMDYLLRDSYFAGVEYGRVDVHRIINSFEASGERLALDQGALYAFEALMIARYEMFRAVYFHRTVRSAEIAVIKAIELVDDELSLTSAEDLSHYLSRTDEVLLHELVNLDDHGNRRLKEARELARMYRDRRLLKCIFERHLYRKDRFMERILSQKRVREGLEVQIADSARVQPEEVFIDVSTAPSIPVTSSRETLNSILVVSRGVQGKEVKELSIADLPLVGAIAGFMDILRVYTYERHRMAVGEATHRIFGREGFTDKVSM